MDLRIVGGAKQSDAHKLERLVDLLHHPAIRAAFEARKSGNVLLPDSVDLSSHGPITFSPDTDGILDQGGEGDCEPSSGSACMVTAASAQGSPLPFMPSVLTPYAGARAEERALATPVGQPVPTMRQYGDTGLQTADLVNFYAKYGVTDRLLTPGLVNGLTPDGRFHDVWSASDTGNPALDNVSDEPNMQTLIASGRRLVLGPYSIDLTKGNASDVLAAALAANIPVQMAFFCDQAFQRLQAGQVAAAPNLGDTTGGGHAVFINGYRMLAGSRVFVLVNSWSKGWCAGGTTLVGDAWLGGAWEAWPYALQQGAQQKEAT